MDEIDLFLQRVDEKNRKQRIGHMEAVRLANLVRMLRSELSDLRSNESVMVKTIEILNAKLNGKAVKS